VFIYSRDRIELPHVHLKREDDTAGFWLNPILGSEPRNQRLFELDAEALAERAKRRLLAGGQGSEGPGAPSVGVWFGVTRRVPCDPYAQTDAGGTPEP
jgi:hypothetical protein